MLEKYKQVVNLQAKEKDVRPRSQELQRDEKNAFERQEPVFAKTILRKKSRAEGIDHVYGNDQGVDIKNELSQIIKPKVKSAYLIYFKQGLVVLFIIVIAISVYSIIKNKKVARVSDNKINAEKQVGKWYSVQLASQEVYYGFIKDVSADPVVLENVYYNYSQVAQAGEMKEEDKTASSIRLVKRGKEAHGPDGTMDIIRSQIKFMEPLGEESKILKAILDYEK